MKTVSGSAVPVRQVMAIQLVELRELAQRIRREFSDENWASIVEDGAERIQQELGIADEELEWAKLTNNSVKRAMGIQVLTLRRLAENSQVRGHTKQAATYTKHANEIRDEYGLTEAELEQLKGDES